MVVPIKCVVEYTDRFHYILTRGNRSSWLVWGAVILMAYGAVGAAWLLAALAGSLGVLQLLAIPVIGLGAASAGYSAFLFRQAEGRDFWQSPLLLPQLLVAALMAGSAALIPLHVALGGLPQKMPPLVLGFAASLVVYAVVLLVVTPEIVGPIFQPGRDAEGRAK